MPNNDKESSKNIYFKVGIPEEMIESLTAWVLNAGGNYEQLTQSIEELPEPDLKTLNQTISMGELRLAISEYAGQFIPDNEKLQTKITELIRILKDLGAIKNQEGEKVSRFGTHPWEEDTYTLNPEVVITVLRHNTVDQYPNLHTHTRKLGEKRYEQIRESLKHLLLKRQDGFTYEQPVKTELGELYTIKSVSVSDIAETLKQQDVPQRKINQLVGALKSAAWYEAESSNYWFKKGEKIERETWNELEAVAVEAILTVKDESEMDKYLIQKVSRKLEINGLTQANFDLIKKALEAMLKK